MFLWEWLVACWQLYHWFTLLILFPWVVVALSLLWIAVRNWKRRRDGWWIESEYIGYNGGFLSEYSVRYCERGFRLCFSGDGWKKGGRRRMIVFVPNEENWRDFAPAWAKGRRQEILARLERSFTCEANEKARF